MAGIPDALREGDQICLYSEQTAGYLLTCQSSSIFSEIAVQKKSSRSEPQVKDLQVITFQINSCNRYKLNKSYRKFVAKLEGKASDSLEGATLSKLHFYMKNAEAENEENRIERMKHMGNPVYYGQVIQLRHQFTNKYIHVSTDKMARVENTEMRIDLCEHNAKHAQFRIMPRYKVKSEGDIVQIGDQVVFESVKSTNQFLHTSHQIYDKDSVYAGMHELNLSVVSSGFSIMRRYQPKHEHVDLIKNGTTLRLFHKECEAYLCAEGLFNWNTIQDVHLRIRRLDYGIPKSVFPSTSAINYWQVQLQQNFLSGDVIKWGQPCHLKHSLTEKYLCVDPSTGKLTTISSRKDPNTVFKFHPVALESDFVTIGTFCRIEHVLSGLWLHAMGEEIRRDDTTKADKSPSLSWTTATMKKLSTSKEMQFADAFTLQLVELEDLKNCNFVLGMIPTLQKFAVDVKQKTYLSAKESHDMSHVMRELRESMLDPDGRASKKKQKLIRNCQVIEILVDVLQTKAIVLGGKKEAIVKVFSQIYSLLQTYLLGDSRKNELYLAKYLPFFYEQIKVEGVVGRSAVAMVTELVLDNRRIIDRITKAQIKMFVQQLDKTMDYRFLDLLSVLCVCNDMPIPENQNAVTESWLQHTKSVYHTALGQNLRLDKNVVYVSWDDKKTWLALHDFADREGVLVRHREFLDHQLDLFGKLCKGRNQNSIRVITEELHYLTWKEAYICLTDEQLPTTLRAKYCELIITLFVDIEGNTSFLDALELTFLYDNIGGNNDRLTMRVSELSNYGQLVEQLQSWIAYFLNKNKRMVASDIGQNMLIQNVLCLVHYMVKYGFYTERDKLDSLLEPLMNLLDGTNDLPYPMKNKAVNPDIEDFLKEDRFNQSAQNTAVVNAKYQAMKVLDLFLNFRFNSRLQEFVASFKTVYHSASTSLVENPLVELLQQDFDISKKKKICEYAVRKLDEIFIGTSHLDSHNLTNILMDLSSYQYDKMVVKSMSLLCRYYSAHENVFQRAIQAQILITDDSCEVYNELEELVPVLRKLSSSTMDVKQTNTAIDILDRFIEFCWYDSDRVQVHPINQAILYNYGVISDVFELLAHRVDQELQHMYKGLQKVVQKCCAFLQVMARDNAQVQARIFDRLDLLLSVKGAHEQLALMLTEVFTGNKDNCLGVHYQQIKKTVELTAEHGHTATQYMELLKAIVKVEEMDLPLKRNQDYVMKYVTQNRPAFSKALDCTPAKRLAILQSLCPLCEYTTSLVDLLASCAEGENKFIESLCHNILHVDEILDVLSNQSVSVPVKRAFVRFFLWVYLRTGVEESHVGAVALDARLWTFLEGVRQTVIDMTKYCRSEPVITQQILQRRAYEQNSRVETVQHAHHSLHYLCDGALPFIEVFFQSEFPKVKKLTDGEINYNQEMERLAKVLLNFAEAVLPLVTRVGVQKGILSCLNVILPLSSYPLVALDSLQGKFGNRTADKMRSSTQNKYEAYYEAELELNNKFNLFATNYSLAFGGENTVRAQIGYKSNEEYTEVGQDEDLPMGPEFQTLIACFIDQHEPTIELQYKKADKLLKQLQISASLTIESERKRLAQQELDRKCLQVLRGLLHNEVVKLPGNWHDDLKACEDQMCKIEALQNVLDDMDAMCKIVVHLNSGVNDTIIQEALALMVKLLFAGNLQVQNSLLHYFKHTREERFFVTIRNRMQVAALAVKERRALIAQHQSIIQEALDQIRSMKAALRAGTLDKSEITSQMGSTILKAQKSLKKAKGDKNMLGFGSTLNASRSMLSVSRSQLNVTRRSDKSHRSVSRDVTRQLDTLMSIAEDDEGAEELQLEEIDESHLEERLYAMTRDEDDEIGSTDGYITLMLRLMGEMCDGQHIEHQNYMREQSDNFLSCDLVGETTRFLGYVYSNINAHNVELVTELLQALVEFVSGNFKNQLVVFDNKLCDYLDFILQGSPFVGCSAIEVFEVKKRMGNLIRALTEENPPKDSTTNLPKVVLMTLEPRSIAYVIQDSYKRHKDKTLSDEARSLALSVAFQYYHILCRMVELRPDGHYLIQKVGLNAKTVKWLDQHTLSVEIVKDERLHKVQFPIQIRKALREAVKETFNYEVDRTSSERINDYMDWVGDIKQDVAYTRKVLTNQITKWFCKIWFPANVLMILLSFVFLVVISITWRAPDKDNEVIPEYGYNTGVVRVCLQVLSILHIIVTGCVVISYMIINRPKGPGAQINNILEKLGVESRPIPEGEADSAHIRSRFLSIRTFWYLSMFAASVMGLIFYQYSFAYHLLHIAEFNQLVNRAIKAVTKNGLSLIFIFIFGIMFVFIFAQVNFAFYRELFEDPESTGLYCERMYECFTTVFHRGLIVSLYEGVPPDEGRKASFYYHKAVTDLLFFMIISVVGLDIIFGIVVDTFAELRDSKWQADQEMKASCFICGVDSHAFEKKPGGFDNHVKDEHNQWSYIYFFMHLDQTRPNDYTALELYVSKMLKADKNTFFPKDRALCLEHDVDESEEKLNLLQDKIEYLVSRFKQMDYEKQREHERLQLDKWETKHKKPVSFASTPRPKSSAPKKELKPKHK